jgi:hypothetical protein
MSNPLKAIGKGVKKVFSGVKKVVKKALKNKFVRIALIAAAIYFAAPYAMSALSGAAAGGTAATATTAAGSMGASATTVGASAISPMAAAGTATAGGSGIMGSLAAGGKAVGTWAANNPLLASTAVNTGGQMLSGYMEGKALEEEEHRNRKRSHFYGINGYGDGSGIDPSGQLADIANDMSPWFTPQPGLLGQPAA